jgi:hypothetical protein
MGIPELAVHRAHFVEPAAASDGHDAELIEREVRAVLSALADGDTP